MLTNSFAIGLCNHLKCHLPQSSLVSINPRTTLPCLHINFARKAPLLSDLMFCLCMQQTLLIPLAFTYWERGLGDGLVRPAPKIENMQTLGKAEGHALNTGLFPGCVKLDEKVVFCLPTAGRRTQFFSPHIHTK